jgi:hypothetical protein
MGPRKQAKLQEFLALESPHPYGVLPGGNRFFGGSSASRRRSEEIFNDDLWQEILAFCDGKTLVTVVQSSRYLYAAGHQPELWRDLVLRRCEKKKADIAQVGPSWKDTYMLLFHHKKEDSSNREQPPRYNHTPMQVPGIYSDTLYRSHVCRSFNIPSAWLEQPSDGSTHKNEVPRISVDKLTREEFFEKYEQPNYPVIIKGAGKSRALSEWQDPDYMRQHTAPSTSFRTTSGGAPLPANFTLDAYTGYSNFSYLEESPLYLFDRTAFTTKQWSDDFFPEFHNNCPYWDPSGNLGHDLLQHLGSERRPDHTWLIMGPKRSGSVFHIDPNATHAWNACIAGRKRWILYPPGVTPPGIYPSADGDEVALPLSVGEWLVQYWKEHTDQCRKRPPSERPLECTVDPGDVMFIPHGWWHMVINLEDHNIAITHNYVSRNNLGNVLKFITEKNDQVSGCRDRQDSVKPEHLYDELTKALQKEEPEALKQAQIQCQSGWTCNAWNSNGGKEKKAQSKENNHKSIPTCGVQNKKRPHPAPDDETCRRHEQPKSVMAKTEKVAAFSFSFL